MTLSNISKLFKELGKMWSQNCFCSCIKIWDTIILIAKSSVSPIHIQLSAISCTKKYIPYINMYIHMKYMILSTIKFVLTWRNTANQFGYLSSSRLLISKYAHLLGPIYAYLTLTEPYCNYSSWTLVTIQACVPLGPLIFFNSELTISCTGGPSLLKNSDCPAL